jgi:beta-mannosidase
MKSRSGGWDWALYSKTCDKQQPISSAFSFGVIKPLYIIAAQQLYITDVVTKTYYLGNLSTVPMMDGPQADFQLDVEIHLSFVHEHGQSKQSLSHTDYGEILLNVPFSPSNNQTAIIIPVVNISSVVRYSMIVPKDRIDLWWPINMGKQTLYELEISYRNLPANRETLWYKKKIGFRTVALITYNEYDDEHPVDTEGEGSGIHGMKFRINGALVFCRGANLVPVHQLISDDDSYVRLANSAADAGMNMLRIWGGGELLPDSFYDVANERGLLIFHDLMFVEEQGHGAIVSYDIEMEIRGIIRRLSSHPSIIIWNGCNEVSRCILLSSHESYKYH